jgi:hypothetical protein
MVKRDKKWLFKPLQNKESASDRGPKMAVQSLAK